METKIITQVKKNYRDYRIVEKFVAGLVLTGDEIKSLRAQQISINEAYVLVQKKELYVVNMSISSYKYSRASGLKQIYSTKRRRKLLLKKKEIAQIIRETKAKNYSIIPLQVFLSNRGWAKIEIALAQHLRKYQIKEKLKEKELKKSLREEDY